MCRRTVKPADSMEWSGITHPILFHYRMSFDSNIWIGINLVDRKQFHIGNMYIADATSNLCNALKGLSKSEVVLTDVGI
jgi:hypothetical protein